jgi:hypothetical protein
MFCQGDPKDIDASEAIERIKTSEAIEASETSGTQRKSDSVTKDYTNFPNSF